MDKLINNAKLLAKPDDFSELAFRLTLKLRPGPVKNDAGRRLGWGCVRIENLRQSNRHTGTHST